MSYEREVFLAGVMKYIEKDPEAAAYVADYVQAGLRTALKEANHRAADMEVALVTIASRKHKGSDQLIKSKLEKWSGKTSLNWDWLIERLGQ